VLTQVVGGSIVMALGAGVIALSSVTHTEHERWRKRAAAEGERYGVDPEYTAAGVSGREATRARTGRTLLDWLIVAGATAVLAGFASMARPPQIAVHWGWVGVLAIAMVALLVACGVALWKTTRFA
jgi:hypothetical protein